MLLALTQMKEVEGQAMVNVGRLREARLDAELGSPRVTVLARFRHERDDRSAGEERPSFDRARNEVDDHGIVGMCVQLLPGDRQRYDAGDYERGPRKTFEHP